MSVGIVKLEKVEQAKKQLKWLRYNFPQQIPAKNDTDKIRNCINQYVTDALNVMDEMWEEIRRLRSMIEWNNRKENT